MTNYSEFPENPANLYINDHIITQKIKNEMLIASRSPDLIEYTMKKYGWTSSIPDLIWWSVHGSTMKQYSKADQRQIRKCIFGWLPTCSRLKKFDPEIDDVCPSCNFYIENNVHIIRCNCALRVVIKNKWLESFDQFLSVEKCTPPNVLYIIFNHILWLCFPQTSIMSMSL